MFEIWFEMQDFGQRFVVQVQGIEEAEAMWDRLNELFLMVSARP